MKMPQEYQLIGSLRYQKELRLRKKKIEEIN